MSAGTNINRFLILWETCALENDATWRGYHILSAVRDSHVKKALKEIGLGYAHDHAISQFCALYEVPPDKAREVLGGWWLWSRIARGGKLRVAPRRAGEAPCDGVGPLP